MELVKTILNITPSPSMLKKVGSVDFHTSQAISELIANSFDARIGNEPVEVKITWDNNKIEVIDNAKGMNLEGLSRALSLGETEKQASDKGMYGLGLKSASSSLGNVLEIKTLL